MKKSIIILGVLFFVFLSTASFASEPSKTSDTTRVPDKVSTFAGDVTITFEKGKAITINAIKMVRKENQFVLKGNVEIKYDNLAFYAEKAAIHTSNDTVLIKLKSCEIKSS